MRLINTRAHGIYDYLLTVILVYSPALFNFSSNGWPFYCALISAIVLIITAVLTNYELGPFKIIPLKLHFWIDFVNGLFLCLSPWLFGFENVVFKPHFVFGLSIIIVSLLTDRLPFYYVRGLMGKTRKSDKSNTDAKGPKGFHFIYSAGEELIMRLLRRDIQRH